MPFDAEQRDAVRVRNARPTSTLAISGHAGFAFSKATTWDTMPTCENIGEPVDPGTPAVGGLAVGDSYLCATLAQTNTARIAVGD